MRIETTDFLVDLADINRTKTSSSRCSTTDGDVLVKVEQFAFTANNMTYALIGASTGWYWDFFPAPDGVGFLFWGFGKVAASEVDKVETGEDLFGYFPMSTHVVLKPGRIRSDGLRDASEHRAHLSPAYNYYVRTFRNPAFDAESKREIMLPRPLFFASFLVHDLLAERVGTDADTIAITSASSKTAIGLAHLLSTHKVHPCAIIGGGNSAGQAAVFLAKYASKVHMLIRSRGLAASMSRYLIDRISATPWIELQEKRRSLPTAAPAARPDHLLSRRRSHTAQLFLLLGALVRSRFNAFT